MSDNDVMDGKAEIPKTAPTLAPTPAKNAPITPECANTQPAAPVKPIVPIKGDAKSATTADSAAVKTKLKAPKRGLIAFASS